MADASVVATQKRDKDFGKTKYGCEHYRRRCRIRSPCCNQVFTCRHCHNEATSALSNPKDHHELDRHKINQVICAVCDTGQEVSQVCSNCGVNMGEYYCDTCKFFDDETEKKQFHCEECGICRVGGRENFFHCPTCGSCYAITLRNNHQCIENSMKNQCPVCYEYLFDSVKSAAIMKCGHTIHMYCFDEMMTKNQYRCPLCFKATVNMSENWKLLDEEITATPMPEEYRMEVSILCNDCNSTGMAPFHVFGLKCSQCGSYNTRRISAVGQNDDAAVPSEQGHQD